MSNSYKILSFNIRFLNDKDGINNWNNRKELVYKLIYSVDPDIICFQEVIAPQLFEIRSELHEYRYYSFYEDGAPDNEETMPIFYKNLEPKVKGTFWYSDTPDQPSMDWTIHPRMCTWIIFNEELPFIVMNNHFCLTKTSRVKSFRILLEKQISLSKEGQIATIMTGDFNFNPAHKEYRLFHKNYLDSWLKIPNPEKLKKTITFHNFSGAKKKNLFHQLWKRIDFFWITRNIKVVDSFPIYLTDPMKPKVFPSDHYPILLEFFVENT